VARASWPPSRPDPRSGLVRYVEPLASIGIDSRLRGSCETASGIDPVPSRNRLAVEVGVLQHFAGEGPRDRDLNAVVRTVSQPG
jgi:hypothetical protein